MKSPKWEYGKSPNPRTWHEAAQIIKTNSPKKGKPPDANANKSK